MAAGESSCTKWMHSTVTSVWLGYERANSQCAPVRTKPGSAEISSLGMSLVRSHAP